jgi:hypothetical protein
MKAALLLLAFALAACKPEARFDERFREEQDRLGQSARMMEQEASKAIAASEQAASAMGEEPVPPPPAAP